MKIKYKTIYDPEDYPKIRYRETEDSDQECECKQLYLDRDDFKFSDPYDPEPKVHMGLNGVDEPSWRPINYCPFCGCKIECVEIERLKVVRKKVKEVKEICKTVETKYEPM